MKRDFGTYYAKIELVDGIGWIHEWSTSSRYAKGNGSIHPLDSRVIEAPYSSEDEVLDSILWAYTNGNYSCDCNKRIFIARSCGDEPTEDIECGDDLKIARLTVICPDRREVILI